MIIYYLHFLKTVSLGTLQLQPEVEDDINQKPCTFVKLKKKRKKKMLVKYAQEGPIEDYHISISVSYY